MQIKSGTGFRLAILSTAIGATAAGSAQAALVSEAPSGFAPVTVTATSGSYSFDMDGDGANDFTLAGDGANIRLTDLNTATSGAGTFAGNLNGFTSPSDLTIGNVKSGGSALITSNFGTNPGEFAALATNATFTSDPKSFSTATSGTLGYLQGTYTSSDTNSFQLLDYGLVTADVPEPASLALLATGAAGIAALRRRRRAACERASPPFKGGAGGGSAAPGEGTAPEPCQPHASSSSSSLMAWRGPTSSASPRPAAFPPWPP